MLLPLGESAPVFSDGNRLEITSAGTIGDHPIAIAPDATRALFDENGQIDASESIFWADSAGTGLLADLTDATAAS